VYVAVAGPNGASVRELKLDGNRAEIRTESVTSALLLLADCVRDAPAPS
jgi:nicotinamide-nucleotide amidase